MFFNLHKLKKNIQNLVLLKVVKYGVSCQQNRKIPHINTTRCCITNSKHTHT